MNIAIIGYGRMGHEIESAALARGHAVKLIVDKDNMDDLNERSTRDVDVAIEFTTPETAFENVVKCLRMKIPVVSGTTGWLNDYDKAVDVCNENRTSFIHSTNFSIGVNILFRLNRELAGYMSRLEQYKPFIEEIHHIKKLDAPSGTAITLAQGIAAGHAGYDGWCPDESTEHGKVPVKAIREGMVPGTHTITWNSDIDVISLRHEARNRKGLALGAVIAAEYIYNRTGVFTLDQVLGF
jgi:4-hydroxy-tetrahydrodipicolinate reductase